MARAQYMDFLQSFRFWVSVLPGTGANSLQNPQSGVSGGDGGNFKGAQAGFMTCSAPELTLDAVMYREGQYVYSRKQPGIPTTNDISLTRGVSRGDSSFFDWVRAVVEGAQTGGPSSGEYRSDVDILHFHRDTALTRPFQTTGATPNNTQLDPNQTVPARKYHLFEAFPIHCKVASDLDGTAAEVSVQELTLSFEHFEVEEVLAP